ncbi:hypothetical protein V5P93_005557 [Actinokineospora auranticolor]|uniref:DUF8017 domain-containing protein n=1 Tax=Actinokineospora auranticolor TaxID=155976 RepID=A0A2S6GQL2_9PSEU|nr:hypothetical protein [Actinokineospora auranticolor]PPK67411.1 hypothetical protein CLV40_10774 [Actinokineospora auranticolor]
MSGAYQGFGTFSAPPPRRKTPLVVGLVLLLVVVAGAVITGSLLEHTEPGTPVAQDGIWMTSTTGTTTSRRRTTTTTTTAGGSSAPVAPDWQTVRSSREKAAYDVPKDWEVGAPDLVVGFEDNEKNPVVLMHDVTTYLPEACPNAAGSYRGHTGFVSAGDLDLSEASRIGTRAFADAAALNADNTRSPVSYTDPKPAKVDSGRVDAYVATATLTVDHPGPCPSPTVLFTGVAFKSGTKTVLFMMYQDQGVSDSLPADIADKVISSLRPA